MRAGRIDPMTAVHVALFAGLTAVSAFVRLPIPPVPVTLQTAVVLLSGLVLGAGHGALSQIIYLTMGLVGFPVFAKGGGIAYIEQPSFGYLAGFAPAAWVCGLVAGNWRSASLARLLAATLLGLAVIYLAGVSFLYWFFFPVVQEKSLTALQVMKVGIFPFVPFDLVKILCLLPIIALLRKREHLFPDPGGGR